MSWVRVWVHAVFSTKNRAPIIHQNFRQELFTHIKENAKSKDIMLVEVNGAIDHVHCLFSLNKNLSLSKTLQLIKGESSFWINKQGFSNERFIWQDDYWAVSVSEVHLESVIHYIRHQEQHHKKKTFNEEIDVFMEKHGWTWQEK